MAGGSLPDFNGPGFPGGVPDPGTADGLHYLADNGHWSVVTGASGGTVTSVALTLPAELSVAGSPVTGAGTLAVSKATQAAQAVWAGPTSGPAAVPTFRSLIATDLPLFTGPAGPGIVPDSTGQAGHFLRADATWAAVGTVSSVALSAPGILTVSGSPVTGAGTLALSLATQSMHLAWLGPLSGSPATPTFRAIDSTDLPVFTGAGSPGIVPDSTGQAGNFLRADGSWNTPAGSGGTVTNVSATVPLEFVVVVNNPASTPHIGVSKATQAAHAVWAGPTSGSPATPAFRSLLATDLPVFGGAAAPGIVPDPGSVLGYFLRDDGTWVAVTSSSGGTVTSVALSAPAIFGVAGSPVTTAGTLALSLATQGENLFFAGPLGGSPATPAFRAIVSEDLPLFGGVAAPGIVPDPVTNRSYFLRDDGIWADAGSAALDLHITDGTTTVHPTTTVHFGANFAVGSGGGGVANVTYASPGIELDDGSHDLVGVTKVSVGLMTVGGTSPNATLEPITFGGAGLPGVVPDPITATGTFLRDDGSWASISATPGYVLHVTQGATDLSPVGKLTFSNDFSLTDGGGGWAEVGWVNPGFEVVQGGFDQTGVRKLTVVGATVTGTAPDITLTVPHLVISDGSTSVNPASSLVFTSGGTVTDAGGGIAHVAVTAPGITLVAGAATQTNVAQVTVVGATLTGSSPDVTLTIDTASSLTASDGSTSVHPATTIAFTSGATVTNGGGGTADVAIHGAGLELDDGSNDQPGVFKLTVGGMSVLGSAPNVSLNPHTFGGAGLPGFVPDPITATGTFLRDDGTWQPLVTTSPSPIIRLDHTVTTDLWTGHAVTQQTWFTVYTSDNFTKGAAGSLLEVVFAGFAEALATTLGVVNIYACRLVLDPGGSPAVKSLGGVMGTDASALNPLMNGSVYLDGIAAGSHVVAVQVQGWNNDFTFSLLCATNGILYNLHLQVVEHP